MDDLEHELSDWLDVIVNFNDNRFQYQYHLDELVLDHKFHSHPLGLLEYSLHPTKYVGGPNCGKSMPIG